MVRKLRSSNKHRMKAKLKRFRHAYRAGKVDADAVQRSVQSYQAHLAHGDCWHLERSLLSHLVLSRSTKDQLEWDKAHPLKSKSADSDGSF